MNRIMLTYTRTNDYYYEIETKNIPAPNQFRLAATTPLKSDAADPATIGYSFLSTRENNSLLRPRRAAAELKHDNRALVRTIIRQADKML